ncbi:hypothetical protein K466DRAFT_523266 [Polyporus arcularius HHB13444]|uniref:Uncharacterized protein n=1 Tax=Polyporus arcularius HHB13444 TaxID=1314778 RepID=A0A5C3PED1_9APHY|nr:hypothetical protein K466DRAFT_523266 [Polyporus arcularius HHB13444]
MSSPRLALLAVVVLAALNAYVDLLQVRATHRTAISRPPPLRLYSFIDEDYPPRMPLPSARRTAKLTLEDSVRYSLWSPETYDEWLWTATVGDGNVHYGPNRRLFVVSVTHQLHCMRSIREALEQDTVPHGHQVPHLTHCLNFIRMSTLCAADITLEPADAFARNYTRDRAGGEHVCMDWPAFYEDMKENSLQWNAFRNQQLEAMAA